MTIEINENHPDMTASDIGQSIMDIVTLKQTTGLSIERIGELLLLLHNQNKYSVTQIIAGILGQSENEHILSNGTYYSQISAPDVTGTNMVVIAQSGDLAAPTEYRVTNENVAAGNVSVSMATLACWLRDAIGPEIEFIIADLSVPGTGRPMLADDTTDETAGSDGARRYWADFQSVIDLVETNYGTLTHIIECWYNSDAAYVADFKNKFWPLYFGVTPDGTEHPLGTTYTSGGLSYQVDHCIWDATAPIDQKGRGVVPRATTKWVILQSMVFLDGPEGAEDPATQFTQGIRNEEPLRANMDALVDDPIAQSVGLIVGPSAHISDFNGGIHPVTDDKDGVILYAAPFAAALMRATGIDIFEPTFLNTSGPENGAYLDWEIDLPNGGTLTTLNELDAANGIYSQEFVKSLKDDRSKRGARIPLSEMKVLGTDTLPTGATYDAATQTLTIPQGVTVNEFNGWNLSDCYIELHGRIELITDCYIKERSSTSIRLIDIYATGSVGDIQFSDFYGLADSSGLTAAIANRLAGDNNSAGTIGKIRRCAFFDMPTDILKTANSATIVENYFDTPINMPYEPPLHDSGEVYGLGELVHTVDGSGNRYAFKSLISNNTGNTPPTSKTSTAEWENQDPHVDAINPYAIFGDGMTVAGNYINMSNTDRQSQTPGYGWGLNNALRVIRNTDSDVPFAASTFANNIIAIEPESNAYPIQLPDIAGDTSNPAITTPAEAQTVRDNWIVSNASGAMWYSEDELEHNITGNTEYAPSVVKLPTHRQQFIGVELFRLALGHREPVYQTDESGVPAAYKGRVLIIDSGSGNPRTGKIRLIPEQPLEYGDSVSYLRGQANGMIDEDSDVPARVYRDMGIEHIPALTNNDDLYPWPGIAVKPKQSEVAGSIAAPPFVARAARFDGTDAIYTEENISVSDRGVISVFFRNNDPDMASSKYLLQGGDGTIRVQLGTTSSGRLNFKLHDDTAMISTSFYAAPDNVQFETGQSYLIQISWIAGGNIAIAVHKQIVAVVPLPTLWTGMLTQFGIGADRIARTNYAVTADIGHCYINFNEYIDMETAAGRDLFSADGAPIDIGDAGQNPTGNIPAIYCDGDGASWNNRGSAGPFDIVGELEAAPQAPGENIAL